MLRPPLRLSTHNNNPISTEIYILPKVQITKKSHHQSSHHKCSKSSIHQYLSLLNKFTFNNQLQVNSNLKEKQESTCRASTRGRARRKGAFDRNALQFRKQYYASKCPQLIKNVFTDIVFQLQKSGYSKSRIGSILQSCSDLYQIHYVFLRSIKKGKEPWLKSKIVREEKQVNQLCEFYFSGNQHKFNHFILELRLFKQKLIQQMITLKNKENNRLAELILHQNYFQEKKGEKATVTKIKHQTQCIVQDLKEYMENSKKLMNDQFTESTKWLQTFIEANQKVIEIEK